MKWFGVRHETTTSEERSAWEVRNNEKWHADDPAYRSALARVPGRSDHHRNSTNTRVESLGVVPPAKHMTR